MSEEQEELDVLIEGFDIKDYIVDGVFDVDRYGWDFGVSEVFNLDDRFEYVFETGETIMTTRGKIPAVSKKALAYLPLVIIQMKNLPSTDTAPNVEGTDFKPCEVYDAFTQY